MYHMEGKTAIITGGAAGIGYATAERFLEEGVNVAICDVAADRLAQAAKALGEKGTVYYEAVDISDFDAVTAFVKRVHETFGSVDFLINNAGITRDAQFYKMDIAQFQKVIDVNLMGSVHMCKACVPYMMEQHFGKIVNCSSVAALSGNFGQTNYSAAKGAMLSFTHTMGKELLRHGINVNVIAPLAWTAQLEQFKNAYPEAFEKNVHTPPMGYFGDPEEDIGRACVALAHPDFKYMSGETLTLEGGLGQRP